MNKQYTVNVLGNKVNIAELAGRHAYYSKDTNITAIEIPAANKREARKIAKFYGKVLFIFE